MRRALLCIIGLLAISVYTAGQTSSDTQTLQALLSEVRALRQDLRVSLNRAQSMQILLARFQMQEGVVTRASDRLNDARQKVLDIHTRQKDLSAEVERLEDAVNAAQNQQQQAELQDRIKHVRSGLEITGNLAQQQQTAEIQAEQRLREEQDKLGALESQMDELIRAMGSSAEKTNAGHP